MNTTNVAPLAAPAPIDRLKELGAIGDVARLARNAPRLLGLPKGRGQVVMAVPGFGAGDLSTLPLRRYLTNRGLRANGWGLGVNTGDADRSRVELAKAVRQLAATTRQPVHLIGWSMGGVLARETARDDAASVAQVITYGSPVVGGPKYTQVAAHFGTERVERYADEIEQRNRTPINVPVTSIYSQRDGIVDWRACIDSVTPDATNVEVRGTHIGMGFDPDVWALLADTIISME